MFIVKFVYLYINKEIDNESCINNDFNKGWLLFKNYNRKNFYMNLKNVFIYGFI